MPGSHSSESLHFQVRIAFASPNPAVPEGVYQDRAERTVPSSLANSNRMVPRSSGTGIMVLSDPKILWTLSEASVLEGHLRFFRRVELVDGGGKVG